MLAIKNNLMAESAARHLGKSYDALGQSVQRLSSGLRINSAKDDAAGLAVRELVRADIATFQQGARNARDAISMLQTAEGAMSNIDELLIRMKELAEQASTDSYSSAQRAIMDAEFQQLAEEITRVAESTTFNGIALLDDTSTYNIHVGTTTTIDLTAEGVTATDLGLGTTGTEAYYTNVHSAADANSTGWASQSEGDDFVARFSFTSGENVDVTFVDTLSYSINEVASMINVASQASADAWNMASVVYDSDTNMYSLKLTAYDAGVGETLTIAKVSGTAVMTDLPFLDSVANDFAATAGTDASSATAIDSKVNAVAALASLGTAINTKDSYRAKLGYMMNRLESAVSVLDIQSENLMAAESRISDVDVATEMAAMTRNQVLSQAGISMLAQANTMPQMALQLLRG